MGTRTSWLSFSSHQLQTYKLYLPVFGWYSPNGKHTEGSGVVPDIAVDVDPMALSEGVDDQLDKAMKILQ